MTRSPTVPRATFLRSTRVESQFIINVGDPNDKMLLTEMSPTLENRFNWSSVIARDDRETVLLVTMSLSEENSILTFLSD